MIDVGIARVAMTVVRPVADEQQDRRRDQHAGQQEVEFHFLDRVADEPRLVANDIGHDVRRKLGANFGQPFKNGVGHGHGVGARLLLDDQAHGVFAIEPSERSRFLVGILGAAHVLDADRVAFAGCDDEVVELLGGPQAAESSQHHLARPLVDSAAGNLQVLPV